ncbi:MAG: hypothetical protein J6A53_09225 [Clostridia bacterium]|nr:hypothetical protein [Clostridia bacterium]
MSNGKRVMFMKYATPEVELMAIMANDVITVSGGEVVDPDQPGMGEVGRG